ncbi:hypothetical protein ACFLT9_10050 [Acidobacteriota bacterium]
MKFYFVLDHKKNYRYFSSEPVSQPQVQFSRLQGIWELAKQKLMLLPKRILSQEQAFGRTPPVDGEKVVIQFSGNSSQKKVHRRFFFFLQKKRTQHTLLLAGEAILLPISGLMALIPGPNVFFGVLALIMYTQWQALKGINRLSKNDYEFTEAPELKRWERAVDNKNEEEYQVVLDELEMELGVKNLSKILWK